MSALNIVLCLICAVALAGGQLLLKAASMAWNQSGTVFSLLVIVWIGSAFLLYTISSFGWLYLLRQLPVSVAYPFLSLTFLLVPVGGFLFFGERLSVTDGVASMLIISGLCVASFGKGPTG